MEERDDEALRVAGANNRIMLPSDPFWPIRVPVSERGGSLPFQFHILYRWQFGDEGGASPQDLIGEDPSYDQADGAL